MPLSDAERYQKFRHCDSYARYVLEENAIIPAGDVKTVTITATAKTPTLLCIAIDKDGKAMVMSFNTPSENRDAAEAVRVYSEEKGLSLDGMKTMHLKIDRLYKGELPKGLEKTATFKEDPIDGPKGLHGIKMDPRQMGLFSPDQLALVPRTNAAAALPSVE